MIEIKIVGCYSHFSCGFGITVLIVNENISALVEIQRITQINISGLRIYCKSIQKLNFLQGNKCFVVKGVVCDVVTIYAFVQRNQNPLAGRIECKLTETSFGISNFRFFFYLCSNCIDGEYSRRLFSELTLTEQI